jgi:hypothetical protein
MRREILGIPYIPSEAILSHMIRPSEMSGKNKIGAGRSQTCDSQPVVSEGDGGSLYPTF